MALARLREGPTDDAASVPAEPVQPPAVEPQQAPPVEYGPRIYQGLFAQPPRPTTPISQPVVVTEPVLRAPAPVPPSNPVRIRPDAPRPLLRHFRDPIPPRKAAVAFAQPISEGSCGFHFGRPGFASLEMRPVAPGCFPEVGASRRIFEVSPETRGRQAEAAVPEPQASFTASVPVLPRGLTPLLQNLGSAAPLAFSADAMVRFPRSHAEICGQTPVDFDTEVVLPDLKMTDAGDQRRILELTAPAPGLFSAPPAPKRPQAAAISEDACAFGPAYGEAPRFQPPELPLAGFSPTPPFELAVEGSIAPYLPEFRDFAALSISPSTPRLTAERKIGAGSFELRRCNSVGGAIAPGNSAMDPHSPAQPVALPSTPSLAAGRKAGPGPVELQPGRPVDETVMFRDSAMARMGIIELPVSSWNASLAVGHTVREAPVQLPKCVVPATLGPVEPKTMEIKVGGQEQPCGFPDLLISCLAPILVMRAGEAAGEQEMPSVGRFCFLEAPSPSSSVPVPAGALTACGFADLAISLLAPVMTLPDTKQPTQLPRLAGVGICLAEPPSASRGNFGPSILVPAQAEFDVEVSVVVPILAVQETSRPNPATVPVQPFYPLEPVAAREAVLEPSREPARIESLRLPVALPALSERLRAQDWPHQIGQAGFCPVPPPDVQQIEIIPLPGAEFVSLEPELVFPAPAAPEKARAALPTSGKAKEWIRAIDDDPWPMAGATWFEQRVRIAMPLLTIAASGRMKQPQRLWPIRPACYLPGARACAAVGAFDVEWPARKAILPYGESLPIATPIRSDMYAPLAAPPPKREVAPVEALPGFFATLPGRVKRLSVGIPLMMMFLFALWSSDSTGKGGPWARLTTAIQHRAMAEYIEDFHKGTNAWRGDGNTGANWSYDPAGFIRPANLGLYQPSMAMTDYRMEFLGQIDQKSLGWVFRASNARNYYAMKLEIVKPGPLPEVAIVRYSVVDGHPGAAVRVPVRVNFHNSTPYRVRSEIAGKKFATYIEDELADIFTDDRFQKGGIGFFSEKDERASLYWVKVTDNDDFLGRVCSHLTSQKVQPSTALQSLILNRWIFDGGSPAPFLLNSQIR